MSSTLYEKEGWDSCVQHIISSNKSKNEKFNSWVKEKDLGNILFDPFLYLKGYNIQKKVNEQDRDHFIVISGKEGEGKSTIAIQLACVLDPSFCLSRICYEMADFLRMLRVAKKGQVFILDEGNMFLFNRESYSDDNRFMVKLFALMRQLNLIIIINLPNFFTLDSYVRDHRADMLINCHTRGKYVAYVGKGIKVVSKEGTKYKTIRHSQIPAGTFWFGYWNKFLPRLNDIDPETYKKYKREHFDKYLADIEKAVNLRDKSSKFVSIKDAVTILPVARDTMINLVKSGEVSGKMIAGKWFVERRSLVRLHKEEKE